MEAPLALLTHHLYESPGYGPVADVRALRRPDVVLRRTRYPGVVVDERLLVEVFPTVNHPSRPLVVASAGIGVVGVTFGMARYGFGLLAPDIRATFALSSSALGLLAAASYLAYLVSSLAAGLMTARLGPRAVVAVGGVLAVAGMTVAGLASTAGMLFTGLLVAGSSAGLVFPPFTDVVAGHLRPQVRSRVLSAISAGTGWGICVAAPVALVVGSAWRTAWLVYAALAAGATVWALLVLPGRDPAHAGQVVEPLRPSWFRSTR